VSEYNENKSEATDDEILAEARKRYASAKDAESDNDVMALDDLRFLSGGNAQWMPQAVAARELDGRPIITVNTLPTYLHQVTNDQRMNTPSIKVHPVDDKADVETAKVLQGLIRDIEYESNADVAYDTAVNSAAAIGKGFFRLVTDYEEENSFNQCIKFQRIRNSLTVKIDSLSVEPDGSDMQWAFIEVMMSKDEFKRLYPKANAAGDSAFADGQSNVAGWITDSSVRCCEYYCIETESADVVLLSNGESGFKDDLLSLPEGVTVAKTRKSQRSKVVLRKITGCDVLEKTEIKCKWIPVFPVYGDEIDIEGKIIRSGIIRNAKGPASMYNVMMTSATEEISLRAKAPYIMAEGQEEGHEKEWQTANNRAYPYLLYKPVTIDGTLAPAPQRNQMADVPVGALQMAMHAADDVKKTTGLFDASLGARGTATSGKQELAQQREGDMANYHYADGLLRTLRHAGRCLVNMIPHYYDSERVVRVLGDDDTAEYATINEQNATGKMDDKGIVKPVLNDITVGKYNITVSSGPSFSTLRQEAAEGMASNMEKNPALWDIIGDLYVRSQDWPNADKIANRLEKAIDPRFKEAEKDASGQPMIQTPKGPLPMGEAEQAIAGMDQHIAQLEQVMQESEKDRQTVAVDKMRVESQKAQLDAQQKLMQAEADRIKAELEAQAAQLESLRREMGLEKQIVEAEIKQSVSEAKAEIVQAAVGESEAEEKDGGNDVMREIIKQVAEGNKAIVDSLARMEEGRRNMAMQIKSMTTGNVYEAKIT
jgi:hypothetical protein